MLFDIWQHVVGANYVANTHLLLQFAMMCFDTFGIDFSEKLFTQYLHK